VQSAGAASVDESLVGGVHIVGYVLVDGEAPTSVLGDAWVSPTSMLITRSTSPMLAMYSSSGSGRDEQMTSISGQLCRSGTAGIGRAVHAQRVAARRLVSGDTRPSCLMSCNSLYHANARHPRSQRGGTEAPLPC
jgi:hypothetical protein